MDLEFTDDQELLAATVARFLADRASLEYVRAHLDDHAVVDDVWEGLADLGLVGLLAPEDAGGASGALVDLALALVETGRGLYPGPFAASAVGAVGLLSAIDAPLAREWLPRLATGEAVGTVALIDDRSAPMRRETDGTLHGARVHVPDAVAADLVLVPVDGVVVALTSDAPGVTVTPTVTVDGTRKFGTVTCRGAAGPTVPDPGDAVAATRDRLAVAFALDGVGAASRALELAVAYAGERVQFGRPVGSFQAVQHLAADMLRAVELGRAAAYYAAWACDEADPTERRRATAMVQAFTADAFYGVGASAIQIFGGVGFTWEHDIHLYYKRLLTLAHFQGSASDHLATLASLVL